LIIGLEYKLRIVISLSLADFAFISFNRVGCRINAGIFFQRYFNTLPESKYIAFGNKFGSQSIIYRKYYANRKKNKFPDHINPYFEFSLNIVINDYGHLTSGF
jgi:hypothetical protein